MVFTNNTAATNQVPQTVGEVASGQVSQTIESYVTQLVEAKGKVFQDPEVVAKSKIEADAFIKDLERQNSELRGDLGKQDYAKELLSQLKGPQATPTANVHPTELTNPNGGIESGGDTNHTLNERVDLESLINETLQKREATDNIKGNLKLVDEKLSNLYGTEADAILRAKGAELGLSREYLQTMAGESPQAFFTLIGEEAQKVVNPVGQSTINTAGAFQQSQDRDYNYYSNIRKNNPSVYYSPKVQQEMFADAQRLGGKFGL